MVNTNTIETQATNEIQNNLTQQSNQQSKTTQKEKRSKVKETLSDIIASVGYNLFGQI
jgi:hypothetical protein